ncbi:hypothetical protein LDENG_00288260, partial [Lucifuga dentata]
MSMEDLSQQTELRLCQRPCKRGHTLWHSIGPSPRHSSPPDASRDDAEGRTKDCEEGETRNTRKKRKKQRSLAEAEPGMLPLQEHGIPLNHQVTRCSSYKVWT